MFLVLIELIALTILLILTILKLVFPRAVCSDLSYNDFTWQGPQQPACQGNMSATSNRAIFLMRYLLYDFRGKSDFVTLPFSSGI